MKLENEVKSSGRGPGNFYNQYRLKFFGDTTYLVDQGNARLKLFDKKWNEFASYILEDSMLDFDVSNGYIYILVGLIFYSLLFHLKMIIP